MANSILDFQLVGRTTAASPCTGQFNCSLVDTNKQVVEGALTLQQNSVYKATFAIPQSGTQLLAFDTILNSVNEVFIPTVGELAALLFKNEGPGDLNVRPDATDGWVGWLQAGSIMELPANTSIALNGLTLASFQVGATNNELLFTETGTGIANITIELWGRK